MTGKKDEKSVVLFDLSKNPPEKKEVAPSDIASTGSNDVWKHPPAANKIGTEKLADIVAYIKYATTGTKKAVDPAVAGTIFGEQWVGRRKRLPHAISSGV